MANTKGGCFMANASKVTIAARKLVGDFLCVKPGENVVITADTNTDPVLAIALVEATRGCGAEPVLVTIPQLPYQGGLADPYIPKACRDALGAAQVWIDATFPYMAGSAVQDALMETKAVRYLLLGDPSGESVVRLFGEADLDQYFEAQNLFDEVFGKAKGAKCRIECPRGTNVSFKIGSPGIKKPRRAEEPGMYVVPGSCSIPPDIETVEGRIVISSVFHTFYEVLQHPIEVEVKGSIQEVRGTGTPALLFEKALKRAVKEGMGSIIHFTHGLLPTARFTGRSFVEDMRAIGNNAVGFGIPWWLPGGGETHPDGVVLGHSVWLEDQLVIEGGRIVWPEKLAKISDAMII